MTQRPLYRWKSFWLGVLVMAGLAWAWWLSYDHVTYANWGGIGVSQQVGYVTVGGSGDATTFHAGHDQVVSSRCPFELMPPPFFARGRGMVRDRILPDDLEFHIQMEWAYSLLPKEYWRAFVPHWLLMLVFLGAWVSFLGWRWRWRWQRMRTRSEG